MENTRFEKITTFITGFARTNTMLQAPEDVSEDNMNRGKSFGLKKPVTTIIPKEKVPANPIVSTARSGTSRLARPNKCSNGEQCSNVAVRTNRFGFRPPSALSNKVAVSQNHVSTKINGLVSQTVATKSPKSHLSRPQFPVRLATTARTASADKTVKKAANNNKARRSRSENGGSSASSKSRPMPLELPTLPSLAKRLPQTGTLVRDRVKAYTRQISRDYEGIEDQAGEKKIHRDCVVVEKRRNDVGAGEEAAKGDLWGNGGVEEIPRSHDIDLGSVTASDCLAQQTVGCISSRHSSVLMPSCCESIASNDLMLDFDLSVVDDDHRVMNGVQATHQLRPHVGSMPRSLGTPWLRSALSSPLCSRPGTSTPKDSWIRVHRDRYESMCQDVITIKAALQELHQVLQESEKEKKYL